VDSSSDYAGRHTLTTARTPRTYLGLAIIINAIFWVVRTGVEWYVFGLFYVVGVDWSRFWGATKAFVHTGPNAAYQLDAIAHYMQPLAGYYAGHVGDMTLKVGPAPYPPIFLAIFAPFTLPPAPVGFLLWTLANLILAVPVARSLSCYFPVEQRRLVAVVMLLSYPLVMALFVGQMVILLLFAFWRGYLALERGDDLRAGAWFGLLLMKPQYAAVLFLVLLLKRRWPAIVGGIATGLGLLLSSLIVGGIDGIVAYVRMLLFDYPNYSGGVAISPQGMISWRGLMMNLEPDGGSTTGLVLTAIFSVMSLSLLLMIWRGAWNPRIPRFHNQMLATMLVTLLVAYHSQVHGAVLLMVPAAMIAAGKSGSPFIKKVLVVNLFAPPVVVGISALVQGDAGMISLLYLPLMIIALGALFKNDWPSTSEPGRVWSRLGVIGSLRRDTSMPRP
jgi:hypothetical protein